MSEYVERVARSLMNVRARRPADPNGKHFPVLAMDRDFDDLPLDSTQGTADDEITQEAVLLLARAAIEAMREPTEAMLAATNREWDGRMSFRSTGAWQAMIDEALK